VISRGNAGEKIFKSKRDKEKFLGYLEKAVERFSIIIHTYCLMDNHYHLLMETSQPNLSAAVQWINVSYAVYFNRKRQRSGHLFQGRFKAILIDADEYLKQLSRYIHLNPVRAKIAENPSDYKWSSHRAFIGVEKPPPWLEIRWLLSQFGRRRNVALGNYRAYVEDVEAAALENPIKDVVGGMILGNPGFVNWVKNELLSARVDDEEVPQLKELKPKPSLDTIVKNVCDEMRCNEKQILQKGHKRNINREMAIFLARDLSGMSGKALGQYFGGISGSAITLNYNHFMEKLESDKKLVRKIDNMKKRILNI
jgi:REP element-mobilizing transposase RayT